jgi:signal transduction histidine kinase
MDLQSAQAFAPRSIDELEHELRTPLASILSLSEILRDHPQLSEAERQRFLEAIHAESGRLAALVDVLLRTGRLDQVSFN